jgi:hypothetical protein
MVCEEQDHTECDESSREDSDTICDSYNAWLIARGVELTDNLIHVRSPLRKGDRRDKIPEVLRKEWGLMSGDKPIPKGKTVCRVPKAACFMGDQTLHMTISETDDSQLPLAVALLKAIDEGPTGPNWPKVQTLPTAVGVSWAWQEDERKWLQGTELEEVIIRKRARVSKVALCPTTTTGPPIATP